MIGQNTLVSIIVITYNSAKYVLETLESAKAQTYRDIELIVSDDCSSDETVEICQRWLEENKERFVSTRLITVEKNTGTAKNCNRGLKVAKGEWLKYIAGDDLLHPDGIKNLVGFTVSFPEAKIIESEVQEFAETLKPENFISYHSKNSFFYKVGITPEEQYKILLDGNCISAIGMFLNRTTLINVSGFEEKYTFLEDYPTWLKLLKSGNKIYFFDRLTTYYRIHSSSITSMSNNLLFSNFYKEKRKVEVDLLFPHFSIKKKLAYNFEFYRKQIINRLGLNRKNKFCELVDKVTCRINPFM